MTPHDAGFDPALAATRLVMTLLAGLAVLGIGFAVLDTARADGEFRSTRPAAVPQAGR